MDSWFDTLARAVAGRQSRRDTLKRVGGVAVAVCVGVGVGVGVS